METIMSVYPRHKAIVDNMAIFKTRAAAEQFVKEDPFILEGLVKSFVIKDWNDSMLPE